MNWALARHEGWRLVMRLEDLDLERVKPGAHDEALEDLRALGIDWDGPALVQSADLAPYRDALARLAADGRVFRCERSRKEIRLAASAPHADDGETRYPPELRPPEPWPREVDSWSANHRLRLDPAPEPVHDAFLGDRVFDPGLEAGDLVVWTKLGVPAYQLAVVVDDARQGVTDVVRGDDLLASAARQQVIARALGLPHARWWHVPLVHEPGGKRLAKRHGAHSLRALRDSGATAERIVGWCAASIGLVEGPRPLTTREFLAIATPGALRAAIAGGTAAPSVFGDAELAWIVGAGRP